MPRSSRVRAQIGKTLVTVAGAVALACPATAMAANAGTVTGSAVAGWTFTGNAAVVNQLSISHLAGSAQIVFEEATDGDTITNGSPDCTAAGANRLVCPAGTVEVLAGEGNDSLTVGDLAGELRVVLRGGPGDDTLRGAVGDNTFYGDAGNDLIQAGDGRTEIVDCGDGVDSAVVDAGDLLVGCEAPISDVDGDGVFSPVDCNDASASVRPGAEEVEGNGIDEDCDGADTPRPPAPERVSSTVSTSWRVFPFFTRLGALVVKNVEAGARITIVCRKRAGRKGRVGCPFRRRVREVEESAPRFRLTSLLAGRRLRVGAVVEVRITQSGFVGKVVRYRLRRGKPPLSKTLCLRPGASAPHGC